MDAQQSILQLSPEQRERIFQSLRDIYSDFPTFNSIAARLKQAILDTNHLVIGEGTKKKIAEDYFNRKEYYTEELDDIFKKIQQIFKTAYTLVLYDRELNKQLANPQDSPAEEVIWVSIDTFLAEYPEFVFESESERQLLFKFRNYAKIATLFIEPRLNKQLILNIAGRLEGSQCSYITGGGQRQEVTNRVIIYEREGGTPAEPRPDRALNKIKKKKAPAKGAAPIPGPVVTKPASSKRRASVVSNSSGTGSDSEFEETPKRRKKSPKSKPAPAPTPATASEPALAPLLVRGPGPAPAAPLSTTATAGQSVEMFEFPVDWSAASQIVSRWELPKAESYISALLKGEVPDESL